jgi:hypothetical protein
MDGCHGLMAAFLVDRNQGLPHGVGSVTMGDIDELINSNAFSNWALANMSLKIQALALLGCTSASGNGSSQSLKNPMISSFHCTQF